ncbi:hypothetical protein GCM10010271_40320 [Streptomyces kurssanovii]|nr:hypothetical protein GCM10010271_40320 [Streptomyces kurssanovii]
MVNGHSGWRSENPGNGALPPDADAVAEGVPGAVVAGGSGAGADCGGEDVAGRDDGDSDALAEPPEPVQPTSARTVRAVAATSRNGRRNGSGSLVFIDPPGNECRPRLVRAAMVPPPANRVTDRASPRPSIPARIFGKPAPGSG